MRPHDRTGDTARHPTFDERVAAHFAQLGAAEQRAVRFFQENREEVLVASASALASRAGTSDATVVRATKALGYSGMGELRRQLLGELRQNLSPEARMARTLREVGQDPASGLSGTLDIHVAALETLRRDISTDLFRRAVERLAAAQRVFIFGIGPSSAMADYLAVQLGRVGIDGVALTETGLLLADGLHRLRKGDLVVILAYGRVYREIEALLGCADRLGLKTILVTDTLGPALRRRVDLVLPVARGKVDMLSMHTATLGLLEALLVGVAAARPTETLANLRRLNELRAEVVGRAMDLGAGTEGHFTTEARRTRRSRKSP